MTSNEARALKQGNGGKGSRLSFEATTLNKRLKQGQSPRRSFLGRLVPTATCVESGNYISSSVDELHNFCKSKLVLPIEE